MKLQIAIFLLVFLSLGANAETTRLINQRDMYPSPSPDGLQVTFQSNRSGVNQVFIMNMDGTGLKQLTEFELGAETPVFSPDGEHIVFAAYLAEGNNDVFVMNPDGSNMTRLTDGPGYDGHPHWSADSTKIVFNSDRTSPEPDAAWSDRWHEIYTMNADGSDVTRHTNCRGVCTYPGISPDGQLLTFRKTTNTAGFNWSLGQIEKNSEVFVMDLETGSETNLSNNAAFDGWPVFSPNGEWIAFASNRSGPALTGQVWIVRPDGSDLRQVTSGELGHAQPAWSADGKSIYAYQFKETEEYEYGSIVQISL